MNNKGFTNTKQEELSLISPDLCEICCKKDEEDLYIIFNVLYRVVIGGVFHRRSKDEELSYELDMMQRLESETELRGLKDEEQTPEQKIFSFKEKISRNLLIGLVTSPEFQEAVKEIFKAKYETLMEHCNHFELAMHFLKSFEIINESTHASQAQELAEIIPKIKAIHNSILLTKSEIQAYHSEIQNLSDHIVSKLFTSHSNLVKKYLKEDEGKDKEIDEEANESDENDIKSDEEEPIEENPKREHRRLVKNNKASSSGSNGTTEGKYHSERSTEAASSMQYQNESRKQSKSPTFKSKLPKKATDVLKTWFLNHIQNPYPSHEAKETLSKLTGLSKKQIQNWFTNSRKRFLEPLKKKMDGKKSSDHEIHSAHTEKNSVIDDQSSQARLIKTPEKIPVQVINPEPQPQNIQLPTIQEIPTTQPQLFIPPITIQDQNKFVPQRIIPATMQPATIMYQGYIPTNNFNPSGNIVILQPYMPQPSVVYPYNPQQVRGLVPMNAQFVQLPQGNTITVVNQSNLMGGSYIVPMQPSIGMMTKHNLSTNFNTINNNVYNSINNMGSVSEVQHSEGTNENNSNNNLIGDHTQQVQIQNSQNPLQSQQHILPGQQQFQYIHQQQIQQQQQQIQQQLQLQQQQQQAQQQHHIQQIQQMHQLQHIQQLQQNSQPSLQQRNGGEVLEAGNSRSTQKVTRPKTELPEVFNTSKQVHKEDGKET